MLLGNDRFPAALTCAGQFPSINNIRFLVLLAGADIMMQLDDVVGSTVTDEARFEEATHRTTRWLDRCIAAHSRPAEQNLFAIIQGGLDPRLREISLEARSRR